jgi:hypothetical protein
MLDPAMPQTWLLPPAPLLHTLQPLVRANGPGDLHDCPSPPPHPLTPSPTILVVLYCINLLTLVQRAAGTLCWVVRESGTAGQQRT